MTALAASLLLVFWMVLPQAHAADLVLVPDPAKVALTRGSFALYVGDRYAGMLLLDGAPLEPGGARLVATFTAVSEPEPPTWQESVDIDLAGTILALRHAEGEGERSFGPDKKGRMVERFVASGLDAAPPTEAVLDAVDGPVSNAHLLMSVLPGLATPLKGDRWVGHLLDGSKSGYVDATVTWQGPLPIGGGRTGQVAALSRAEGAPQAYVVADGALVSLMVQAAGMQWVAAPREQLLQRHAQESQAPGR